MSGVPVEDQDPLATLEAFFATPDWDSAHEFADGHPELRDPQLVTHLVVLANMAISDADQGPDVGLSFLGHAGLLCGSDWPDGPGVVAAMTFGLAAMDESPIEPNVLDEAVAAAGHMLNPPVHRVVHPTMLPQLLNMASMILVRAYRATGTRDLLDQALASQRLAVAATQQGDNNLALYLNNLANRLADLYRLTGDFAQLDEALATQRRVIATTLPTSAHYASHLNNLANRLADVYAVTGDRDVLDEAVTTQRRTVEITPASASTELARNLQNLAAHLHNLYHVTGERRLLEEAITTQRKAVDTTPRNSVELARKVQNLSAHLTDLYEVTGERGLLDEALEWQRQAVASIPPTSTDLGNHLNALAARLGKLYMVTGELNLLKEAVTTQRRALEATPETSMDFAGHLAGLARWIGELHRATGDRELLDEAIALKHRALTATPVDSTEAPSMLNSLAVSLGEMYELTGDRQLLDKAIATHRQAIAATPPTSPELPGMLSNLSMRMADSHGMTGDRDLLDEAIATQRQAIAATPVTSPELPAMLTNLTSMLVDAYGLTGEQGLLETALATQRRALAATPPTSTELPGVLSNLGLVLGHMYELTGDRDLLDEALTTHRRARTVTRLTSTDVPRMLNLLATRLADMYAATGERRLLDEAVTTQREAVAATPPASTDNATHLNNLAMWLADLYRVSGVQALLDEAVTIQRQALAALPPTSTRFPTALGNLALRLAELYDVTGDRTLLDEAVALQRQAVAALPPTSANRPAALSNLALRLADMYAATGDSTTLDEAWELIGGIAAVGPWDRIFLARTRANVIRLDERRTNRYSVATRELTDALGALQLQSAQEPDPDPARRRELAQRDDGLLSDLVASHVLNGHSDRAIELIEGDRMWLSVPKGSAGREHLQVPVAWVVASKWETVVVTTLDHNSFTHHVIRRTRDELGRAVQAVLNAVRVSADDSIDARHQTVSALCELTTEIVSAFPKRVERLLIIPLGLCALLPYTAAKLDGGYLIDNTAVTLAPSLAWARAAFRRRPNGTSFGAFHPGKRADWQLDLEEDRQAFEGILRGTVLNHPTAQQVLDHLVSTADIGHLSCHGAYNAWAPLESALEFETNLTIQAVLNHAAAPWLVNLSACETAIADQQASEQLISFPTAFLLGGAAHVLSALWPIRNDYATAINRDMYRRLAGGIHPAFALQHAIKALRDYSSSAPEQFRSLSAAMDQPQDLDLSHPAYWAAFTHFGSPW